MLTPWRARLHEIVFESETPAGKAFDVVLITLILASVGLVMLDSVSSITSSYGDALYTAEWAFTIIFTIEYLVRIFSVGRPFKYVFSFFGIVDLLAILPTYLSLLIPGTQYFLVVRIFRILRVFRIFKLGTYLGEAAILSSALKASRHKITVFLIAVISVVVTMGALMYVVEGPENGFTSIPVSVYWAIVTMTTVGFGDITPKSPLGQFLASCLMILGYGIIAVPTGIVTSELTRASRLFPVSAQACPSCSRQGHDVDATFCKFCGSKL